MQILAAAAAAILTGPAADAPKGPDDPIAVTALRDDAVMIEGFGGNVTAYDAGDGLVVADVFFPDAVPGLLEALGARFDGEVAYVVTSHHHGDHSRGVGALTELQPGAVAIAHDFVRARLGTRRWSDYSERWIEPRPDAELADLTHADGLTLHPGGREVRLLHFPAAHTGGDTVTHFVDADVIATGDIFWNGVWPIVDDLAGGSPTGVIAALDALIELGGPDTVYVPGHGPVASRADVEAYRDRLAAMREMARAAAADGESVEDFTARDPFAATAPDWKMWFPDAAELPRVMFEEAAAAAE